MKNFFAKVFGLTILSVSLFFFGCGNAAERNSAEKNEAAQSLQGKFPQFTTINLSGEQVTSEIFAQKKITVLNIWGTFCPPCVDEMPELGNFSKQMSSDVQLVGLVCDVSGIEDSKTIEAAKEILQKADANFLNIIPNKEIIPFLEKVVAVPTTIFLDSQGNIIGEPIVGADVEGYKKRLKELLDKM